MEHPPRKLITLVALAAALACGKLSAQSDNLLTYDFTGKPGDQLSTPASTVDSHLSVTDLQRGSGIEPLAVENSMASTGWSRGEILVPENEDYLEFTVTPKTEYSINLTDLDFYVSHSTAGPKNFTVRTSLDDYASDATNVYENVETGAQKLTFTFSPASAFENLSQPVTVRIYGWNASSRAGGSAHLSATLTVSGFTSRAGGAKTK